jgi:hypothetical protein
MLMVRVKTCAALLVVVAGCAPGRDATSPQGGREALLNNGVGVTIQANGAGVVDLSAAGAGDLTFEFVAKARGDGTAFGHFRQSRMRATGLVDFSGTVTCLTIDPNFPGRARIGGVVTENNSTDPAFMTANQDVGADVWFRVEDRGNGEGAAHLSTTLGFKPTLVDKSSEYCALPFDGLPWWNPGSLFPVSEGTIRVNP